MKTTDAITKTPGVCGGRARLAGTRLEVSKLEFYRRGGIHDTVLCDYFSLTMDELAAAWAYVAANSEEVEAQIREMNQ